MIPCIDTVVLRGEVATVEVAISFAIFFLIRSLISFGISTGLDA
jgi:hypothetical protein